MLRRLVFGLAILVGLSALADRALAQYAGHAAAGAVQRAEHLGERPDVTFHGFPFLTQAVRGRFTKVTLTARDVRREQVAISRIEAELRDVKVGLGKVLGGKVEAVPVRAGTAKITLRYADLNTFLRNQPGDPHIGWLGGVGVEVQVNVGVPGQGQVPVLAAATVEVVNGTVRVKVRDVRRRDSGQALPAAAKAEATKRAAVTIPLRTLPFGIRVTRAEVTPDGVIVTATARGFVIPIR